MHEALAETRRLQEARAGAAPWRLWGPYLAERAWGTVREDYSANGDVWRYFTHEHAASRAYRWNEDGLLGISDESQRLCFALALWNEADDRLKERLFGLTGHEGNHGEDAKEYWYYLDNVPSHAYMRALYKYPQRAFPYDALRDGNARRGRNDPELELLDTGIFEENRYFDVQVEYAKGSATDLLIRITATNRGPDDAPLWLLPTLWFRNTWSWGLHGYRPSISVLPTQDGSLQLLAYHETLGRYHLTCEGTPEALFTENETNTALLFDSPNATPYVKDAFHDFVVRQKKEAVNPDREGTKCATAYRSVIPAGGQRVIRLRLSDSTLGSAALGPEFDETFALRLAEADAFHRSLAAPEVSDDERLIQRQSLAGLLWSKQFYHYDVRRWLLGDPAQPPPPAERCGGRNHAWKELNNHDVICMPDKWEYPWYAAWDLAFHTIPLALVDPELAKEQLVLLLREWYMHPNGQLPAYEWAFSDVNPPVHAWAAMRVYQIERRETGAERGDTTFLARVFHKLLINFTWWVNRKDADGRNVFQGGFLGLDNIGAFNRSELPGGARIDQSDGTSWMAMFCLNMLAIALELARHEPAYEDVATKFLEHFFHIAHAMNDRPATIGDDASDLWDNQDEFYYDLLRLPNGTSSYLRVRSAVGLAPLLAVETIDPELLDCLPHFHERLNWFLANRADLVGDAASVTRTGEKDRRLFALVSAGRLRAILSRMLDEREFLSPHGLRSVSRWHAEHPFRLAIDGGWGEVAYEPAESRSGLFGGNSNWRGPVWFPLNYLIIEALQKFDWYYGPTFRVEHPAGSGRMLTLWEVSVELSRRLIGLFVRHQGKRPVFGDSATLQQDPHWRDLILFHEYFHGDTGAGLGASHQTGWTALVAKLIQQSGVPSVT